MCRLVEKENEQLKSARTLPATALLGRISNARGELAKEAVGEAASLLNADTVKSGWSTECFSAMMWSGRFWPPLPPVFSAEAVQQRSVSPGEVKLGEQIASPLVTFELMIRCWRTGQPQHRFDGEGVPTPTKDVIAAGELKTYLHNLKTAKKDGVEVTGNASEGFF